MFFVRGFADQSRRFDFGHTRNKHAFEYLFYNEQKMPTVKYNKIL